MQANALFLRIAISKDPKTNQPKTKEHKTKEPKTLEQAGLV